MGGSSNCCRKPRGRYRPNSFSNIPPAIQIPPTITDVPPTVVEHSQTTVIATVAPGVPGDTLTLTETAGLGAVSLGPPQGDGTEQVIYTAPASISQSAIDAVTYTVNESDGAHATASANVKLNAGPTIIAATVSGTEGTAISDATVATFADANPNATASDFTATITGATARARPAPLSRRTAEALRSTAVTPTRTKASTQSM